MHLMNLHCAGSITNNVKANQSVEPNRGRNENRVGTGIGLQILLRKMAGKRGMMRGEEETKEARKKEGKSFQMGDITGERIQSDGSIDLQEVTRLMEREYGIPTQRMRGCI